MLKKSMKILYFQIFALYQNIPYLFFFLPKTGSAASIYNLLLLRPCTLFVLQTSQNLFGLVLSKFGTGHRLRTHNG